MTTTGNTAQPKAHRSTSTVFTNHPKGFIAGISAELRSFSLRDFMRNFGFNGR